MTDLADNSLVVAVAVKRAGKELKAEVATLQYNAGPAIALPQNKLEYEWSLAKDDTLKKLRQGVRMDKGQLKEETKAKYNAKKDQTEVKVHGWGENLVFPGFYLLQLETSGGELIVVVPSRWPTSRSEIGDPT